MTLTEKTAYIKGLMEGLGFEEGKKETKILNAIIDVLNDMALSVEDMDCDLEEMNGRLDEIDEDLNTLEEEYYAELDDDELLDEDFESMKVYEVKCPTCGEVVCIDSDMAMEGSTECPACGELLEFEFDDDCDCCCCEDDDCDCGCGHDSDDLKF